MATKTGILGMFARSPVRPLQQHMDKAHICAELLIPFVKATIHDQWEEAEAIRDKITIAESEADDLKLDIRQHLPKDIFLPVPRMDLLELLGKQEIIANTAKDISGIMLGRKMRIPNALAEKFMQYLQRSVDACTQANTAISELDELLESGFRGREVDVVEKMILELNCIENDNDKMQVEIRSALFSIEKELAPVDVIFIYKIIDWVGLLADTAQQVGSRLRMLSAK